MSNPLYCAGHLQEAASELLGGGSGRNGRFLLRLRAPGAEEYILSLMYKEMPTHHLVKARLPWHGFLRRQVLFN